MKKQFGDYYLGLDIGTDSVGYAVTDTSYNVLKFNKKGMWGSRLFPAAKTAADTRLHRANRRRIERLSWRMKLLQELFAPEISKVDMGFFLRQKESNLQLEEKSINNKFKYSLFGADYMTDSEYYDKYPTIYHLKYAQLNGKPESFDVRLLYLSIAHYFKARGHFLFDGLEASIDGAQGNDRFVEGYNELVQQLQDEVDVLAEVSFPDAAEVKKIITNEALNITNKEKALVKLFNAGTNKSVKAVAGLLCGGKKKLSEVFLDESLDELSSVSLRDGNLEQREEELETALGDRYEIFLKFKAVYDLTVLDEILQGCGSIAEAKVMTYEQHKRDLELLKGFLRTSDRSLYKEIFGVPKKDEANYSVYIGSCLNKKGKKAVLPKKVSQDDLCSFIVSKLKNLVDFKAIKEITNESTDLDRLFYRLQEKRAFPRLRTKENGVIPVQINAAELKVILTKAAAYLPFLSQKDDSGLSVADKVLQIMNFRVPYYVGPLAGTEASKLAKRCWVERTDEKIYPWNFDKVVDKSATAETFIRNMTNKCTYLFSEDVLPKQSLLYTEFEVRNELNNLSLNGERLSVNIIQGIIDNLFLQSSRRVTKKGILQYLKRNNIVAKDTDISSLSGVDDTLTTDMKSFRDFYQIFGREYVDSHREEIENIILWITLFADSKDMLEFKIKEKYPNTTKEAIKAIKKLSYNKWGRLSATLLNSEAVSWMDDSIGEPVTIIKAMRCQPLNLMQLIAPSSKYGFNKRIEEFNESGDKPAKIDYRYINALSVSPAVKRSIWQTVQIVQELKKITGHDPKYIFIEMAKGSDPGDKKRTLSRKMQLDSLYKSCVKDTEFFSKELLSELDSKDDANLRSKKLYLYFLQMGRDMYTGKRISIEDLFASNGQGYLYDCDHIFPRSKTKDDSLDNLVLVHYKENREKSDIYPLSQEIRTKQRRFWQMLLEKGLMSKKKFDRLTRATELSADELAGFINRQLVETRQSTKAAAQILSLECPNSKMVYSKAGNVSDFRKQFSFIKCRDLNELHHAKDAYLNIVVGNVFDTLFTDNPYNMLQDRRFKYTLRPDSMYQRKIQRGSRIAWVPGEDGTLSTVRRFMEKNNIQVTNMTMENKGEIFGATIEKASDKKLMPIKKNLPSERYGGYTGQSTAYFVLVESEEKKGRLMRTVEAVPVHLVNRIKPGNGIIEEYLQDVLSLVKPRVIIEKILVNSCFVINGCPCYITGTTGKQLTGKPAAQLILAPNWEKYLKCVIKFNERYKLSKGTSAVSPYDGIDDISNQELYEIFADKLKESVYVNRPSISYDVLADKRKAFVALSLEEQCLVIGEILKLFQAKPLSADLTLIGGAGKAGTFKFSKNITKNLQTVFIRNISVTGLFEQKPVDLRSL